MNYLNIHTDLLKSEDFIGSEPTERATWLCLLGWCATQENGGIIQDCESWKDRQWQQLCGVTKDEVKTISKLYGFQNGNLMVSHYPIDSENAVKAKRAAGKKGGRPRKGENTAVKVVTPPSGTIEEQREEPYGLSDLKRKGRKGKERKGKEREGNGIEESEDPSCPPSDDEWLGVFPTGSTRKPQNIQGQTSVLRNNDDMNFIGSIFRQRETTLWKVREAAALQRLSPPRDEMETVRDFHARAKADDYPKKGISALLNDWGTEVTKARASKHDSRNSII